MNREQARNLVVKIFENPFNKDNFLLFLKNLLKSFEEKPFVYRGSYISHAFEPYISSLERIGKYSYDGKEIDLLIVQLKKETSLERARAMQRNFIAWYLKGSRGGKLKDAALVAFVSPENQDWRFSLVKMDYRFEEKITGKVKVKEEFTPAKRWSFLVGKNENSHTAQSRFIPILMNDEYKPTLEDLEEAFNVEIVTNEFFQKYRDLFIRTKLELDKIVEQNQKVKQEFQTKNISTVDFTKKLLSQITFLYFLQKKGWFGVKKGQPWGTGQKDFMRRLFNKEFGDYQNFYNDILEPLFFEALRTDRSDADHYFSRFDCKLPFLNGGLFDPINNYNWVEIDIMIPDDLFSNSDKTKEADQGDGILDIFDRFNFTVNEEEPLEKEVALDPELLGKIYEKLNAIREDNFEEYEKVLKSGKKSLETKFNKEYGVYYTPREIVHYMCQESLISYLETEMHGKVLRKALEKFVEKADSVTEIEAIALEKEERIQAGDQKTTRYETQIPEIIRRNAKELDQLLANIKVLDPSVGSGAFPIGMMHEIVKMRKLLSIYLDKEEKTYNFKRSCIENSLYGVDIDNGAVEICKLRFWLSMIVDEEDFHNIKPLPNLDYKVVRGDSLLKIEKKLLNFQLFDDLEKTKPLLFSETSPSKKQDYKKQIDELFSKITNGNTEFDIEVYFSEVFHQNGGFDVVIANPPYIQLQKNGGKLAKLYEKLNYETFARTGDIYALFYERGIQLLKNNGLLCFITSNKWMRAGYGEKLRNFFARYNPQILIDLGPGIFETATVDTNILLIQKKPNEKKLRAVTLQRENNEPIDIKAQLKERGVILTGLTKDAWFIGSATEQKLKEKIERIGKPLKEWDVKIYRGVLTGLNKAFIIDSQKREEILSNCKDKDERRRTEAIIKPILRGRDIKRYYYKWTGLWVIIIPAGWTNENRKNKKPYEFIYQQFPALMDYLRQYEEKAKKRDDQGDYWWELRPCTYYQEFEKEKVVWQELAQGAQFAFDCKGEFFISNTAYILTGEKLKYILGYLNSTLNAFSFERWYCTKLGETGTRWLHQHVQNIPIPPITPSNQSIVQQIEELVTKIISAKKENSLTDTSQWEQEIDRLVYSLYDLTKEEIKIVEKHIYSKNNK